MYEKKVIRYFEQLKTIFLFNLIVRIFNFLEIIVLVVLVLNGRVKVAIVSEHYISLIIMAFFKFIASVGCYLTTKKTPTTFSFYDQAKRKLLDIVIMFPMMFFGVVILSIWQQFLVDLFVISNLGEFTFFLGHIIAVVAYFKTKKYKMYDEHDGKEKYLEHLQNEKQLKSLQKHQQIKIADTNRLLETIGIKFFVKYYDKLEKWSTADLLDEIEENYSEENKIIRIKSAKEIFNQNLNITALEIIANDNKQLTNDETRDKALELLKKVK